jgi:hypothetical protein
VNNAGKAVAVTFGLHSHHPSLRTALNLEPCRAKATNAPELGMLEDGAVKPCRLFGVMSEPQTGNDAV